MNSPNRPETLPPIAPYTKALAVDGADFLPLGRPLPSTVDTIATTLGVDADFEEGREDPAQSKELERQQDA